MKDEKIIEIAAIGFIVLIVAPVLIGSAINVIGTSIVVVSNKVNKIKFNKKIKKGLEDGSIVEINGEYYELDNVEEA